MPCVCEKCGRKCCDCGEKYCEQCLIDEIRKTKGDNASKNLEAGGRFHEKPKEGK